MSAPQAVFSPTVTSAFNWAVGSWPHAGIAGGVLAALALAGSLAARSVRRHRAAAAARKAAAAAAGESPDEGLDVYTVYVTAMAMALSVNGMWHVFTETMHLPWIVRLVACSVLESAGLAFMRLARKDILAKRPATRHVVIVWGIALLSGGLSAGASKSLLEGVIRVSLPLLAVQLCHAWMLPLPTEVTLTQHELGKRAWRYVKATRRLERSGNALTRYVAQKRLHLESDMLTKRSLMTGDATRVLGAAERIAITEALTGLGITPGAEPEQGAGGAGQLGQDVEWLLEEVIQIQNAVEVQGLKLGTLARAALASGPSHPHPSEMTDGSLSIPAARPSHPSENSDGSALALPAVSDGSGTALPAPGRFQMGGSDGSLSIRTDDPARLHPSEVSDGRVAVGSDPSGISDGSAVPGWMAATGGSPLTSAPVNPATIPAHPALSTAPAALTSQNGASHEGGGQGLDAAAGGLPTQPTHLDRTHLVAAEPVDEVADRSSDDSSGQAAGWPVTHPNQAPPSASDGYPAPTHPFPAAVSGPVSDGSSDGFSDGSTDGSGPIRTQPVGAGVRASQPTALRLTVPVDQDPSDDPSETAAHSKRRRSITDLVQEVELLPPPVPMTADGLKDALGIGLPKARELRDLLQATASSQN
jgi:hypothetical protein